MSKLILLSILLTVVYSWEDLKRFLFKIIRRQARNKNPALEQFVATSLMLAVFPVSLVYLLSGSKSLTYTLAFLTAELLLIGCLAIITKRAGMSAAYSSLSLFAPSLRWLDPISVERRLLVKFVFILSLPPALGLMLKYLTGWKSNSALPNMDLLIQIAVAGLIMNIAVEFLERYFRARRLATLSAYGRVLAGILIGLAITIQ